MTARAARMSARAALRQAVQDFLAVFPAPHRQLPPAAVVGPAQLQPIAWGVPDRPLGRAVCESILVAMPDTPWSPARNVGAVFGLCAWCVVALVILAALAIGVQA